VICLRNLNSKRKKEKRKKLPRYLESGLTMTLQSNSHEVVKVKKKGKVHKKPYGNGMMESNIIALLSGFFWDN